MFEAVASGNSTECDFGDCAIGVCPMQIEAKNGIVTKSMVAEKKEMSRNDYHKTI